MDAVTAKPVTTASLRIAIAEGLAVAADRTPSVAAAEEMPRLAELAEMLRDDAVREILATFATDTRANLEILREAAIRNGTETVYRMAHGVAGAARNVGADGLAELAAALEANAGALSSAAMLAEVDAMQSALDSVLAAFGFGQA